MLLTGYCQAARGQNKINIIQRTSGPVKAFKSTIHFPVLFQQHHSHPCSLPFSCAWLIVSEGHTKCPSEGHQNVNFHFYIIAGAHNIQCIHYFIMKWKTFCLLNINKHMKMKQCLPSSNKWCAPDFFIESSDVQKDGHASAAPDDIVENFTVAGNKFVESGTGQTKVSLQRMRCRSGEPPVDDNTLRR